MRLRTEEDKAATRAAFLANPTSHALALLTAADTYGLPLNAMAELSGISRPLIYRWGASDFTTRVRPAVEQAVVRTLTALRAIHDAGEWPQEPNLTALVAALRAKIKDHPVEAAAE